MRPVDRTSGPQGLAYPACPRRLLALRWVRVSRPRPSLDRRSPFPRYATLAATADVQDNYRLPPIDAAAQRRDRGGGQLGWLAAGDRLTRAAGAMASAPGLVDGAVRLGHDAERRFRLRGRSPGAARPSPPLGPGFPANRGMAGQRGIGTRTISRLLPSGSVASGLAAAALPLTILGYDAGLKRTWLGPVFMGGCRGINLLLGMSHAVALGGPIAWYAALAYGIFVTGITIGSRSEAVGGARPPLVAGLVFQSTAILALAAVGCSAARFPGAGNDRPVIPLEGMLVLAVVALSVSLAASRAIERPIPMPHPEIRQDRHPQPGVASRRRGRRRSRSGAGLADRGSLGSGFHLGPVAVFDMICWG